VRSRTLVAAAGFALLLALVSGIAQAAPSPERPTGTTSSGTGATVAAATGLGSLACAGGTGNVQHVIYVQFDNTHLLRDRPDVPSDLEQMPHLLDFLEQNGTVLSNDHTVLISHTGGGILSSITGVYPDRHGQAVSNSFRYYKPDGTTGLGVSFAYWTDGIFDPTISTTPADTSFNMVTADGHNAPAPWVPYTRAGCDVGAVGMANTVLENTGPDVPKVFGAGSPEAQEVTSDPGQAFADFVGVAVHCAQTDSVCDGSSNAKPDLLPDEPGGYAGYDGLFGAKYVDPVIDPSGPLTDLDGNVIATPAGHVGFPGFDGMSASVSLSWVASMQEAGVPVTYAYISDAHDLHPPNPANDTIGHVAEGPGEAGYVQQLHDYDRAFGSFFDRLQGDGITPANTLFVFTVEEGDHFAGGQPANTGCDGVTTPCEWAHVTCSTACPANDVGEVNVNLRGLLATQRGNTTPFDVHSDMAPAFYLIGNPAPDAPVARSFEQDVGALTADNPYTGQHENLTDKMIDPVGMRLLHMVTGDPLRTPSLVAFLQPDYFGFAGAANCTSACVTVQPGFAWNHGGIAPEVATTWAGLVGPGVRHLGETDATWTDHTDLRPTMLTLLGLHDDYDLDGRAITEILDPRALPSSLRTNSGLVRTLGAVYKQLNAPFGEVGLAGIDVSTAALQGDDATYAELEGELSDLTADRDALASQISAALNAATFDGQPVGRTQASTLIRQGLALIHRAQALATQAGS
jgi:hypothetical protein